MTGPQPGWTDLPPALRHRIAQELGARVVAYEDRRHGIVPGYAMHLQTAHGLTFVKAINDPVPLTRSAFENEMAIAPLLPAGAPAPRVRFAFAEDFGAYGEWCVVGYETAPARPPRDPWDWDDVAAGVALARRISELTVPADGTFLAVNRFVRPDVWAQVMEDHPDGPPGVTPWIGQRYAVLDSLAAQVTDATAGDHLVHGTLRRATVLIDAQPGGAQHLVMDWIRPIKGARFIDHVLLLSFVQIEGGPLPERVLERYPFPLGTDPEAVTAYLAAVAGHLVHQSYQSPVAAVPHLRIEQRAQAHVIVEWLRRRLGD